MCKEAIARSEQLGLDETSATRQILESVGINISLGQKLPKVLSKDYSRLERWGVGFNRYSWKLDDLINGNVYDCLKLADLAWINPTTPVELDGDEKISFVPMEAVSDKDGLIVTPVVRRLKSVKSGYTRFKNDDVLWAKITPCMQNGKSAMAKDLVNGVGFGSTEFHIIRSKDTSRLRNEFILLILRLFEIRQAAMRYFVGSAGQQRVPKEFLEGLHIPIPPIEIQNQIINRNTTEREKIARMRSAISQDAGRAKETVEQLILGTLSVEEL